MKRKLAGEGQFILIVKGKQCMCRIFIRILSDISAPPHPLFYSATQSTSGLIILMMSKPLSGHYSHITDLRLVISDGKASCLPKSTN